MTLFAVFGNPVAHSRSPQIHQAFAAQEGRALVYERRLASIDAFAIAIQDFHAEGGRGANVTVPFKTEAFTLADELSTRAEAAQAVNTLFWRDGCLFGDNTDGIGLVKSIQDMLNISLKNKKILLIGAGGAARGAILPLLQQQPRSLTIANRTLAKAQSLAHEYGLNYCGLDSTQINYDVIINATSGSLYGQRLPIAANVLGQAQLVYDMMYAKQLTPFLLQAKQAGCAQVSDGLGMLVAQAAASYELWHGFQPDVLSVVQQIRQEMEQA